MLFVLLENTFWETWFNHVIDRIFCSRCMTLNGLPPLPDFASLSTFFMWFLLNFTLSTLTVDRIVRQVELLKRELELKASYISEKITSVKFERLLQPINNYRFYITVYPLRAILGSVFGKEETSKEKKKAISKIKSRIQEADKLKL